MGKETKKEKLPKKEDLRLTQGWNVLFLPRPEILNENREFVRLSEEAAAKLLQDFLNEIVGQGGRVLQFIDYAGRKAVVVWKD